MHRRIIAALVLFVGLAACAPHEPAGPRALPTKLFVRADVSATAIALVVVEVTAPDIATPLVFNLSVTNGVANGTITVPAGSQRTIALRAYDAGGVQTHSGSVTVDIVSGTNQAISIVLTPLTGDVPVTVTLGSFTVTVQPAAVTLLPGDTAHLTASVLDENNQPVAGQVVWATMAPGVATVVSTTQQNGRVTAVGPGQTTVVAVYGGIAGPAAITVAPSSGPLRVSPANPRYFTDATGRAIYLTGAHIWSAFEDNGASDPPPAFDYTAYLDFLVAHGHNFLKLWRWEAAKWNLETPTEYWFTPMPYQRPGPGTALDGKPRFDLTLFNQAYFDRLRQRVITAGQRGIYVDIMLFNGWSIEDKGEGFNNPWHGHPFNRNNNTNGIDGDPNNDDAGSETHTLDIPAVTALQEAYVRRVVDAVNDLDNVLFEISVESNAGSAPWQYHMIQLIKNYEATKPKQHPVGMTVEWPAGDNDVLFASPADWISPNSSGGYQTAPPAADGRKVVLTDTDHLWGIGGEVSWVWESFVQGHQPIFMDPYDGAFPVLAVYDLHDPRWEQIRASLGYTRTFAMRMNLVAMVPHGELASSGYCLAHPVAQGGEYLVYLPGGNSVTVDLTSTPGTLTVEWFLPNTGQTIPDTDISGGAARDFTAPVSAGAVLYLRAQP